MSFLSQYSFIWLPDRRQINNWSFFKVSYIAIFAKSKETVTFTQENLVKYYNWSDAIIKNDNVYVEVNLEDLSDIMLSRSSNYKDISYDGR